MMRELWWRRLVNSVRFLDDIQDALTDGMSVLLNFETEIPWKDTMLDTLEEKLSVHTDSKTFEILDVKNVLKMNFTEGTVTEKSIQSGTYLMKYFCDKKEYNLYWPTTHGRPERFLAQSTDTRLNNRYVCLTGITSGNAMIWASSVSEYMENCQNKQNHGLFILLVQGAVSVAPKHIKLIKYTDYVSDYDCMMLCLTLISDLSCSRAEKMYLCEAASNIAHNHVELAGLLVSNKLKLIQDPFTVTAETYRENNIKVTNLFEQVRMAVWKAQIKLVFPKLENFRAEIIRKYETKLQSYLPVRSSNNDKIEKAADLEIGQLFYICKENRTSKITDAAEYELLKKMKDARNTLAHWETLSYEQLKEIGII